MRFRDDARIDSGEVQDRRGGGRAIALGGGGLGVVGLIVVLLLNVLGGTGGAGGDAARELGPVLDGLQSGERADGSQLADSCRTGRDANASEECAAVASIQSIQDYWADALGARYQDTDTVFFSGSTGTGCGSASSGTGPFYCPADGLVYVDLSFFQELRDRFGAEGGTFVNAYVLAHEYGHHVQDLLGTEARVRQGEAGPTSGSVRLELQADCYAGTWAHHATTTPDGSGSPLIESVTQDDVDAALDTAGRIGDDFIQRELGGGRADPGSYTHGTSEQRQRWFERGFDSGDPQRCDTFAASSL
ncbi:neutral zinc metallopeptidase [Amnibacterium endophyticum]|uniref:Neutral zinc metallopeptidase n=1 Tax=Amnibacterium endophyticum TaxID=2109337 RepID=A0ABW4LE25_9MICO